MLVIDVSEYFLELLFIASFVCSDTKYILLVSEDFPFAFSSVSNLSSPKTAPSIPTFNCIQKTHSPISLGYEY